MTNLGDLTPAYGRDYTTAKAAKADFLAGKDFIISAITNPWCGKPINLTDIRREFPGSTVILRFDRSRKIVAVKIPTTKGA